MTSARSESKSPSAGVRFARKTVYWALVALMLVAIVVIGLLTGALKTTTRGPSTEVSPGTWLVLGLPIVMAGWMWFARTDTGATPPLAYRFGFHLSGLATAVLSMVVALSFAQPDLYSGDLRTLMTLVVCAVLLQFVTTGRLLDNWSQAWASTRETGPYIVHISTHWAIVVALLGATLMRVDVSELATDALVAASVLTLPLVASANWHLRQTRRSHSLGEPAIDSAPATLERSVKPDIREATIAFLTLLIVGGVCDAGTRLLKRRR